MFTKEIKLHWLHIAAEGGDAQSQFELAVHSLTKSEGDKVQFDSAGAKWLLRAAMQGKSDRQLIPTDIKRIYNGYARYISVIVLFTIYSLTTSALRGCESREQPACGAAPHARM